MAARLARPKGAWQRSGCGIGQNDLWIAAAALQCRRPLATRNRRHFGAVEGLEVIELEPEESPG